MSDPEIEYPKLASLAKSTVAEAVAAAEDKWGIDFWFKDINITKEPTDSTTPIYHIVCTLGAQGLEFELKFEAIEAESGFICPEIYREDILDAFQHRYYMSMNRPYDAASFNNEEIKIMSASNFNKTPVMAAEDDPFADMGFDEPEDEAGGDVPPEDDDSVGDTIDDMADTLDELSESLKQYDEDPVDIETENNIEDHYIAECEKCHGVFITSVSESDQEIERISGTCPLCDEECDQYLKWVIKAC